MDKKHINDKTPPIIEVTDEQAWAGAVTLACHESLSEDLKSELIELGQSEDEALSGCAYYLMRAAADYAVRSAICDGRKPNLGWFLHNAEGHFNSAVSRIVSEKKES